jgi:diguanylate cyclase (GGDEF)-like protein/PAS domain S-box-containing protein
MLSPARSLGRKLIMALLATAMVIAVSTAVTYSYTSKSMRDWEAFQSNEEIKKSAIKDMTISLGYGGMIHSFKNYVLRGEHTYAERFHGACQESLEAISKYKGAENLLQVEQDALGQLEELVLSYQSSMSQIQGKGLGPEESDRIAKVDDTFFTKAMAQLDEVVVNEGQRAAGQLNHDLTTAKSMGSGAGALALLIIVAFGTRFAFRIAKDVESHQEILETTANENQVLASIAKLTTNSIVTTDLDRRITWVNEGFTKITGYTLKEVLGKKPGEVLQFEETSEETILEIREKLNRFDSFRGVIRNRDKYGRPYWIDLDILPSLDASGNPTGFLSVESDVTELIEERERAEAAHRESSAIKKSIEQHTLFSIADPSGKIIDVNQGFCRISGYTREELIGQDHRLLNSGHHPKSFWIEMWKTIASGNAWREEVCNRAKDGSLYWVDSTNIPEFDKDGKIIRFLSLRFDITERKLAESELEKAEAQNKMLAHAVEGGGKPIVVTDATGRIKFMNEAAKGLDDSLGYKSDLHQLDLLFTPHRIEPETAFALSEAIRNNEHFQGRVRIHANSDVSLPVLTRGAVSKEEYSWLEVAVTPLTSGGSSHDGFLIIKQDITEQVEVEDQERLRVEVAEARAQVSKVLSEDGDLKSRMDDALGIVLELKELDAQKKGGIFTLETGDTHLRMFTHVGEFTHAFLADEEQVQLGRCLCGKAALSGNMIVSDNCFEDPDHEHHWEAMTPHGHYIVPLMETDECVGVMFLYTEVNPSRNPMRLEGLEQIGELFANAIARDRHTKAMHEASEANKTLADQLREDISQREVVEEELREAKQRYELAVKGSRDGIWDWDLQSDTVHYAPSWRQMLGISDDIELGTSSAEWTSRIVPDDLYLFLDMHNAYLDGTGDELECEFRMFTDQQEVIWVLCRGVAVRDENGKVIRLAGSLADITEMKLAQEELRYASEHDRLTDLANRELFSSELEEIIAHRDENPDASFAVLFFDFDRFKLVNDSLGHDVGDALLKSISERMLKSIKEKDLAARFGGDEFVLLLRELDGLEEAEVIADRLLSTYEQPHKLGNHTVTSTASIGLVTSEMGYTSSADMIRDADAAMYQAKTTGRGRVVVFDQAMHEAAKDRLELETDLRSALQNDELHLNYQPIIDIETGAVSGFEALISWAHPTRGTISPAVFIPIAEESGTIIPIGHWILETACRQAAAWSHLVAPDAEFFVNINVSKRQLCQPTMLQELERVIEETGVNKRHIKIEITESTIVDNRADIVSILEQVRDLGIAIAMDDFGTGHSSLSGLHQFPIDVLKIDKSFIDQMSDSVDMASVVNSIVSLAHNLGLQIVAEGVEDHAQLAVLQMHGCQYAQGYLFDKPLAVDAATATLRDKTPRRAA